MVTQFPRIFRVAPRGALCGGADGFGRDAARPAARPRRRSACRTRTASGTRSRITEGKWVALYFYPKDATPGCTTQACEFRDNVFAFDKEGAVILGNQRRRRRVAQGLCQEQSLPFTLLADPDKAVTKRYGVLKTYMGVMEMARRDTFLIDPQGKVAKHYESVNPEGHSKVVLADIRTFKGGASGN